MHEEDSVQGPMSTTSPTISRVFSRVSGRTEPHETGVPLREARDGDGPGIGILIAGVFAEYPGIVFLDEEFPELAAPASHYRTRDGRWWVLEDEGGTSAALRWPRRSIG